MTENDFTFIVCCTLWNNSKLIFPRVFYLFLRSLQVYDRLQKLMFCVSKNSTVALVDSMGHDFNEVVLKWKAPTEQVQLVSEAL